MLLYFPRVLTLPKNHHFFLFGARNTGKSTLIANQFTAETTLFINLLDDEQLARFSRDSNELVNIVRALPDNMTHVVIDEIQKQPKLLNTIQRLMQVSPENPRKHYIMTGSSARKLKQGGANLLAGRAYVYDLFPLTCLELGQYFELQFALEWGSLPEIYLCSSNQQRQKFLQAYAHTYLKEEIWQEQFIRQLDPFRRFLEVAAQSNAKIVNYSNIANDVGVDDKTIKNYFSILEDTLIGFFLKPFHNSIRKRLKMKPKFYFFDTGVVRALTRTTSVPLQPQTSAYGDVFEHFIILECLRLAKYYKSEYQFSYLKTQNGAEIDLIVDRPGQLLLAIEIKSTRCIADKDLRNFLQLTRELPNCEAICLCQEPYPKQIQHALVLPWQQGLRQFFTEDE